MYGDPAGFPCLGYVFRPLGSGAVARARSGWSGLVRVLRAIHNDVEVKRYGADVGDEGDDG